MLIHYDEPKVIFVHIPKTAGTSIEVGLREFLTGKSEHGGVNLDWDYHAKLDEYEKRLPNYKDFYRFTFVRNPFDRLYSWGSMMLNKKSKLTIPTKEEFKKWLMEGKKFKTIMQSLPQLRWMRNKKGEIDVHFIGRFENLQEDYDFILLNDLNFKITNKLKHKRKSRRNPDYREMYDQEMIDFVAEYHKEDLEFFGYDY